MIMKNVGDDRQQLGHSYFVGTSVTATSTLENTLAVSTEVKHDYPVT